MRVIRWHDLAEVPWKNGGGTTREIWRQPAEGDFDWRVSVAEVATPGPFSLFPGYDRIIMPLTAHGMRLICDGELLQELSPQVPFLFSGDLEISAELPYGPVTDYNFIYQRNAGAGGVALCEITAGEAVHLPEGTVAVFVARGSASVAGFEIGERDSLMVAPKQGLTATGSALLACCRY